MPLSVRRKLVLLSLLILVVVSFGFTLLHLQLSRAWVEEDLRERAIAFAREIAATIGDRRELESGALLDRQIRAILDIRQNVVQLDVFSFAEGETSLAATSDPDVRLPFTRRESARTRRGEVVSRLVETGPTRYWEVIAPIVLDGAVAGAVAARFSLERADALAARIRWGAMALTAVSVVLMGALMSLAVYVVVERPVRRFLRAVARVHQGDTTAAVAVRTADEFGVLARQFNDMIARLHSFSEELQSRVKEATAELESRYREVERLNEQIYAMQRRLGQAERLAVAGRLMAEVAHEIGTPLHSISGHVELLRQDLAAPGWAAADVGRRLAIIESQLARVTEIIARLLDLTRRPPGQPAAVDVNRVVRETADVVRPGLTGAGLALELALAPGLPAVPGHASQLQQVVLNLLTNAIDATAPGGRVTLATAAPAAGEVEIAVTDTGCGIAPEDRARIFEPFFSTKADGRGAGLGLFISAEIVREHGGRILLDTEVGRGSTFRVRLPARATP